MISPRRVAGLRTTVYSPAVLRARASMSTRRSLDQPATYGKDKNSMPVTIAAPRSWLTL